jgi:hypothetical protein
MGNSSAISIVPASTPPHPEPIFVDDDLTFIDLTHSVGKSQPEPGPKPPQPMPHNANEEPSRTYLIPESARAETRSPFAVKLADLLPAPERDDGETDTRLDFRNGDTMFLVSSTLTSPALCACVEHLLRQRRHLLNGCASRDIMLTPATLFRTGKKKQRSGEARKRQQSAQYSERSQCQIQRM